MSDAKSAQVVRYLVGAGIEVRVREVPIAPNQGRLLGRLRRLPLEEPVDALILSVVDCRIV